MSTEKKTSSTDEQANPTAAEVTAVVDREESTESGHSLSEEIANAVQEGDPGQATSF